jgi:hypothetical protein
MLKVALMVAGLLFVALSIPGIMFFSREPAVPMIMSIYVTMGIFLLLAVPNPAAHRSLIAFAGWANVAHASVMAVQVYVRVIQRVEMTGVHCWRGACGARSRDRSWQAGFRSGRSLSAHASEIVAPFAGVLTPWPGWRAFVRAPEWRGRSRP